MPTTMKDAQLEFKLSEEEIKITSDLVKCKLTIANHEVRKLKAVLAEAWRAHPDSRRLEHCVADVTLLERKISSMREDLNREFPAEDKGDDEGPATAEFKDYGPVRGEP